MQENKKKSVLYIIGGVIMIIVVIAGVAFALINNNPKKAQEVSAPTKASADNLKSQALDALNNKDTAKAKTLLEESQKQYEAIGDTNNTVDTEAQLYLIAHPSTIPTSTTPIPETTDPVTN